MSSKFLLVAASVVALAACGRNNTATDTTADNTMMDNTMTDNGMMDNSMMDNTMSDNGMMDNGMANDMTGMTPGTQSYTVVQGDTKASIAAKLGVPESQLQAGPGVDLDNLAPGDVVTY